MKFEFNWPSDSEEKMFENVDGRTDDGRTTDGRTDAGVTGILIAHLGAFGSGELKNWSVCHQAFLIQFSFSECVPCQGNPFYTVLFCQNFWTNLELPQPSLSSMDSLTLTSSHLERRMGEVGVFEAFLYPLSVLPLIQDRRILCFNIGVPWEIQTALAFKRPRENPQMYFAGYGFFHAAKMAE